MTAPKPTLHWNPGLRLAISDVDETVADVYKPAEPGMIAELSSFISDGGKLFLVTGSSLERVLKDITDKIEPALRPSILISHCSGAEVWGFDDSGRLRNEPFYSIYEDTFSSEQKQAWRSAVDVLVQEFGLRKHPVQPVLQFVEVVGNDPLDIMFDDRGPQITLEFVNAYDLSEVQVGQLQHDIPETHGSYDLRIPVLERAEQLFAEAGLPVSARLGGTFALDFATRGVSKTTAIRHVLEDAAILATVGLSAEDLADPTSMEIWGDKFSTIRGGTDRHMSEALPAEVRSIDFREEDPAEFMKGYNTVIWDGQRHLHHGLAEYLRSRHAGGPIKAWEILSSSIALDEKWFRVRKDEVALPSGKILDDYFVWESPDIAVAVPFTADGKFVICQQYRHAVGKVMFQFPAGAVGKGETAEVAAAREMAEETGFTSDRMTHLADTAAYATKLTGWQHIYLAENAVESLARQQDPEEPTKVLQVTPQELQAMIDNNEFQIPDSLAAALLAMKRLGV